MLGTTIYIPLFKWPLSVVSAWIRDPYFIFPEQNIKPLDYLMNVLSLAPYVLDERRRFRNFRPSTLPSIYIYVMLRIFPFSRLAIIFGNIFNSNLDNVYTLAAMMKSSQYVISHSCFLFSTVLLLGEVVNFLHVLLYSNKSISFTFTVFDSNFNFAKVHISILVPLQTLSTFVIFFYLNWKIILNFVFV
jgi:hypothetical protein